MEEVLDKLKNVSLHTFDIVYDLVFTSQRLIAVNILHPEDVPSKYSLRTALIGNAYEQRQQKIERYEIEQKRRGKEKTASPEELLQLSPRNFALPYEQIISTEIKHRFFTWQIDINLINNNKSSRQVRFNITKKQVPEAQRLLGLIKKPDN